MASEDSPATVVARYLRSNNYSETLDAFLRETNLPPDTGSACQNAITIEQVLSEKKTFDLSQSFERVEVREGDRGWSKPAPSSFHVVSTIANPSNILHVSVDNVLQGESLRQAILASAANKALTLLQTEHPYEPRRSEVLSHGSPILSWVVLRRRYLIASSMSGHTTMLDLKSMRQLWSRRDHQKYVVTLAHCEDEEGFWLATAGWDTKVLLYRFTFADVDSAAMEASTPLDHGPLASITLPSNPESLLFIHHPELVRPVLLLSRRDSTFLYYYAVPDELPRQSLQTPDMSDPKSHPPLPLLGRQNLAPHSNAWIAFTPSALALHPTDHSLIAVATSHIPHMKIILAHLLLPPPHVSPTTLSSSATAPPVLDATSGPINNPGQAAEARRLLAIQDKEDAAIRLQMSTLAPQTAYSTPALAWRPDGTGVWVNGDDGAVRGIEAKTGKVVSVLKGAHEPGSKVRCLWAGLVETEEWVVTGGFDRRLVVWRSG